jgi:class 3 adenylate cyclase/TolB-like protein
MVVADLVESVRLMQAHEDDVIDRWRRFVAEVRADVLPARGGRLVKSLGDGMLLEFFEIGPAVDAALDMQRRITERNAGRASDEALMLRVGLHVGDVVVASEDVFGAGVNLAARFAALGRPGDVIASDDVASALGERDGVLAEDLGECYMKHVDRPWRAWRLRPAGASEAATIASPALPPPAPLVPAVAVLPFTVQPGSSAAPLAGVIADDLVAALARQTHLRVMSRLSVQSLSGRALAMDELDRLLDVDHCVQGTLGGTAGRIWLDVEVLDRGAPVWAGHFEAGVDELFGAPVSLGARAAESLARALLRRQVQQRHLAALPNVPGYTLLLQAMSLLHRLAVEDIGRAQQILVHLGERHPRAPEVHAWMAKWHVLQISQSLSADRDASVRASRACIDSALSVEPDHGLALALQGHLHAFEDLQTAAAARRLADAASRAPNEPLTWLFLANAQAMQGETEEALRSLARAQGLSPFDPLGYLIDHIAAVVHGAAGHADAALAYAERSLAANDRHLPGLMQLMLAQADAGRMDDARATARQYLALRPQASVQRFIDHHCARDTPLIQRHAETLLAVGIPR